MKSLSLLSIPLSFVPLVLGEAPSFINDEAYDAGEYGRYPIQDYKSSTAVAPRINRLTYNPSCDDDGLLTMLSPRGYHDDAQKPRAVILDAKGGLVWSTGWDEQQIYNLMVQNYKGEDYLTFWAGNDAVGGHGAGKYYMLDSTYNLTRTITAANGLDGDLHDFRITPEGTAMMTVYEVVEHDLSSVGKTTGPIWDCLIQEIDLETSELVFEWRAAEHLNLTDSYRPLGDDGEPDGAAWDWYHLNSIDKDLDGNYIISSRYLHTVTKVDGKTGEVLWVLGGKQNMFKDLSGGKATDFGFQHDARWRNNYTEITLFDNTGDGPDTDPRGMRLEIDQDAMTAKLLAVYKNENDVPAASQGSLQELNNGNVILGYGFTGAFAEFAHDGRPLCDVHFEPSEHFNSGGVQSYRVLKYKWRGMPATDPDLAVAQDDLGLWRAYVSWNGATEVAEWVLQGNNETAVFEEDEDDYQWTTLGTSPRVGFETAFALEADHPIYLRVVALDSMANVLATTRPVDASKANVTYAVAYPTPVAEPPPTSQESHETWILALAALAGCGITVICLCARPIWRLLWSRSVDGRRRCDKAGDYKPLAAE